MGGTSKSTQTSTSQATPYAPAQGSIDGILGALGGQVGNAGLTAKQSGALDKIEANAADGNPYAGLIGNAATGLLNGGGAQANDSAITSNLKNYQGLLQPYASGSNIGANSALQPQLDTLLSDVKQSIGGQFAAAGRDGSPAESQAIARGFAQGAAPIVAAQYNTDVQRALDAAASGYNAGNTTYGMLDQNQAVANQNQQAGVGVASSALDANNWAPTLMLNAEQQRFGIPTNNYTTLLGAISPVAQAFGTQNGTQTGTQTMSGAQQFATIAGGLNSLLGGGNGASAWSKILFK